MGKVKRKHRVGMYTSPLVNAAATSVTTVEQPSQQSPPTATATTNSSVSAVSGASTACLPPTSTNSVSASVRSSTTSLSSCSSSTSSLSSPSSSSNSSPSPPWPLSSIQSTHQSHSVPSYTLLDEDSGLGLADYSPRKAARFNQQTQQQQQQQQPQHGSLSNVHNLIVGSNTLGHREHEDVLAVKAVPFSKRTPSGLSACGGGVNYQHQNANYMSSVMINYQSAQGMANNSTVTPVLPQCYTNTSGVPIANGVSSLRANPRTNSSLSQPTQQSLLLSSVGKKNTTNNNNNSHLSTNGLSSNNHQQSMNNAVNGQNVGVSNSISSNKLLPNAYSSRSKNGKYELKILSQPEEQHRARYLTEGSRGAIKDKSGHGYPVVKLCGYTRQPLKVQCFIGHDKHIGTPHLFYQASKIAGKNSTACFLKKVDGTSVITMEATPANNMEINVDCIGILKERNVDVEQKLNKFQRIGAPDSSAISVTIDSETQSVANIKRSTRCRLVFRCEIPESQEILQTVSTPILCTQPLGTPEINKKSTSYCDINGGTELFIIGKNFLKDAKVIFRNEKWIKIVEPNREYLKSTHLICVVPAYDATIAPKANHRHHSNLIHHQRNGKLMSNNACLEQQQQQPQVIEVNLMVKSGGKCSDPHKFYYHIGGPSTTTAAASPVVGGNNNVRSVNVENNTLTASAAASNASASTSADVVRTNFAHNDKLLDALIESSSQVEAATNAAVAAAAAAAANAHLAYSPSASVAVTQYQQQLENEAISRAVVEAATVQAASNSTSPELQLNVNLPPAASTSPELNSHQLSQSMVGTSSTEQQQSNTNLVCEPSVLAAAAVAAANEVQALSDANQLTVANLHQTVTTAAVAAVAASEAISESSTAVSCAVSNSGEQQGQMILNGTAQNHAAVAAVAAQSTSCSSDVVTNHCTTATPTVNSMITYLTASDTASVLAAAASAVKEEPGELVVTSASPPASETTMPSGTSDSTVEPKTNYLNYNNNNNNNGSVVSDSGQNTIQSLLCRQDMAEIGNSSQQLTNNMMNSSAAVHNNYGNQSVMVAAANNGNNLSSLNGMNSMETNPMSFANLDPMSTLKVDSLSLNDPMPPPLPQLSISDINKQLAITTVAGTDNNLNMIPIDSVMNEKPPLIPIDTVMSEKPALLPIDTVLSEKPMIPLDTVMSEKPALIPLDTVMSEKPALIPLDTIMSEKPALIPLDTVMSEKPALYSTETVNGLSASGQLQSAVDSVSPNSSSPGSSSAASVIMGPNGYNLSTSPESKCSNGMMNSEFGSLSTVIQRPSLMLNMGGNNNQTTVSAVNGLNQDKVSVTTANALDSFIQSMTNDSLGSNITSAVGNMLNNSMMSDNHLLNSSLQSTNATTVANSVLMDTLPSALQTQSDLMQMVNNQANASSMQMGTMISTGQSMESISLTNHRNAIRFTGNMDMINISNGVTSNVSQSYLNTESNMLIQAVAASNAAAAAAAQTVGNSTENVIKRETVTSEGTQQTISGAGGPNTTTTAVLANQFVAVQQQQQQQQDHSSLSCNLDAISKMSEVGLINFINSTVFE